jgi:hypothetical protein
LEIGINGPWDVKTLRKSILVLILIFYGRNGPWLESLVKLHVWSLKFESLAEKVLGNLNWKKITFMVLGLSYLADLVLLRTLGKWQIRSLNFQEITILVLGLVLAIKPNGSLLLL